MATVAYGVSSPEVKRLQENLNKVFKQSVVKETGSFDEETAAAVARFQAEAGLPQSGQLDARTAEALREALIPRTAVTYRGQTYYLTKEEYEDLESKLAEAARSTAVARYISMATEVRGLWNAHNSARNDNKVFSWIVDGATGAKFPSEGLIAQAEANARRIESAVASRSPKGIQAALQDTAAIRTAFAAMDQYREEIFGGGEELIRQLENIQTACVVILEISAALATGGASWTVQVGVAAGVGSYKSLLGEIGKAGKGDSKQTVGSAFGNIILNGAIEGGVTYVMKGPASKAFIDKVCKQVAKEAGGKALKKVGSESLSYFIEKAVEGGYKKAFEELLKDLFKACNPQDKMTFEQAVDKVAENFVKGALLQQLDDALGDFAGKNAGKLFSQSDFKGLGSVKLDEALKDGGGKVLETAYDSYVDAALKAADGDPNKAKTGLKKMIVADPTVQKWFADYEKKQSKKKK
jgi:peptidoglycan hydrolase-like protein with peptidoglycan-binding domain